MSAADALKIMRLPGVKAMYPVDIDRGADPEARFGGAAADLAAAINMTGASVAQNQLGLTGKGIKVGVIDTGIDIDHPAFGGSGVNGTTPFPTARVVAGYDFVGDAYNASGTRPRRRSGSGRQSPTTATATARTSPASSAPTAAA